ncbi:MAG: TlpA family protein disulfide reductase [Flavobacteriales bacterium]|jgi:peroxiredoxin|tara:strand:- start:4832 stop:5329 length:498 start_codon:yes stop_codon:yes gene_type:complete
MKIQKGIVYFFIFFYIFSYSQDKMPSVFLKTIEGKSINSKFTYNKNGLTIYSFWATWCVPCINELDAINKDFDKWKLETNVKLVAVSTDDARTKRRVRPLVNGKKWSFDVLIDENQALKRALNINGIPHTIVTKGSKIIYRKIGYKPGEENDLYNFIIENSSIKN